MFSRESPYISNTFSRESPNFQTGFLLSKRSPCGSKENPGKFDNLEMQIFQVWSPQWVDTTTHCSILQHTATQCMWKNVCIWWMCYTLQHTATHCSTLQHSVCERIFVYDGCAQLCNTLEHTVTHCNTLQHTATHCSILQHSVSEKNVCIWWMCYTPQHTATHRNTLQHSVVYVKECLYMMDVLRSATCCNTL